MPERVGNVAWGGPDRKTLYICASTSVYQRPAEDRRRAVVRGKCRANIACLAEFDKSELRQRSQTVGCIQLTCKLPLASRKKKQLPIPVKRTAFRYSLVLSCFTSPAPD